ncbi:MAG: hypothetical protein ACK40G_01690 [Cytophagaceae bacterium]
MKKILILILGICLATEGYSQAVYTIGPMLHFNFGESKRPTVSFAIEGAYWNIKSFPYSFDVGLEWERGKFRIYSEAQTGIGLMGVSSGPFLEFSSAPVKLGLQMSAWANYFWGFDFRYRINSGKNVISPGTYVKLPVATQGLKKSNSSGSSSNWDD